MYVCISQSVSSVEETPSPPTLYVCMNVASRGAHQGCPALNDLFKIQQQRESELLKIQQQRESELLNIQQQKEGLGDGAR